MKVLKKHKFPFVGDKYDKMWGQAVTAMATVPVVLHLVNAAKKNHYIYISTKKRRWRQQQKRTKK